MPSFEVFASLQDFFWGKGMSIRFSFKQSSKPTCTLGTHGIWSVGAALRIKPSCLQIHDWIILRSLSTTQRRSHLPAGTYTSTRVFAFKDVEETFCKHSSLASKFGARFKRKCIATKMRTSTRMLQNNTIDCRVRSLHVGVQPVGHLSVVVFRSQNVSEKFNSGFF